MEAKTDAQLLAGINSRNIIAFDALFHKYYKLLCGYAFLFLKDEENAKDIVQNLFIEIWEKRRFEYLEGNVKSYLYKSVHNRCLNYLRNNETKLRREVDYEEHIRETDYVADHELREQVYKRLETNLDRLPKQRREAISLVYLEDKKYQDVANAMGISINSLKTHLKIGLKNLRDKIKKRE
ncbi:RNA polymerase sigma factor [Olivibacter domesticus]|uniref:RNA polymerase sigma-70 factor, ECF subfamily n=1 Tax=Olivibacter domesticus TaxID=407022 RepID=A0A1H7QGL1_OLID1|nr:RNA polymerase sigma-70 factor [Olivibacter domesticus]SEL47112.1 RNA polymerase sigma-70 factor, ECF subfamily [Olivibacter domesticus]